MNPKRAFAGALVSVLVLTSGMPLVRASSPSREAEAAAEKGVSAYLAGHYEEAIPDLEKARNGGAAEGSHLYMLAYCYETVRHDQAAAKDAYEAAQKKLEQETTAKKPTLESFFYLSNYYLSRQDTEQSKKVASQAAARITAKEIKVDKDGTSQFRAGRIYSNAGDADHALDYYRRAVAAFSKEKDPPPAYLERSLEPVLRADGAKGDPKSVSAMWEKLLALNPKTADGTWNLAVSSLNAGRYDVARDAFKKARGEGGERTQEAFYAERLSEGAQGLVTAGFTIPKADVDGKAIASLTNEEITTRLKDRSKNAGTILSRELQPEEYQLVPPVNVKAKPRLMPAPKLLTEIGEAQRPLVALAIELFRRGESLQENAFTGGYAALIIQNWIELWRNNHRSLVDPTAKPQPQVVPTAKPQPQ